LVVAGIEPKTVKRLFGPQVIAPGVSSIADRNAAGSLPGGQT
jgi:hypothetical protein